MRPVEGASRSSTRTTHGSHQADSPWSTLWTDGISTRTTSPPQNTYLAIMDSTSRTLNGDADWRTDSDGVRRTRSVGKDNRRNLSDHNFAPSVWLISPPPPPAHGPPLLVAQPNFHSVGRHFIFVPLLYPTSPTHALFTPRFSMSHTNSSHMTSDSTAYPLRMSLTFWTFGRARGSRSQDINCMQCSFSCGYSTRKDTNSLSVPPSTLRPLTRPELAFCVLSGSKSRPPYSR